MTESTTDTQGILAELEEMRARLEEAEETLRAIRSGEVDALVVSGPQGNQIFTLKGAESPYRVLVEAMNEGALVLTPDGTVMYSNAAFADILDVSLELIIGSRIHRFVDASGLGTLKDLLEKGKLADTKREVPLRKESNGKIVPALVSVGNMPAGETESISAVVTDLSDTKRTEAELEQYRHHLEELVAERTRELKEANVHLSREIEERKRVEQELADAKAEAERRANELAVLMDAVPVSVFVAYDPESKRITGNLVAQELLGLPPGANASKSAPEDQRPTTWQEMKDNVPIAPSDLPMQRAVRGEIVRNYEMDIVFYNGVVRSVLGNASPLLDEHGSPRGGIAVLMDITDRKKIERERDDLLRREHYIAEMLQKALIPPQIPREISSFRLAAQYVPGLKEAEVGGDFYDIFKLDEGKVGVLIGDVVGKGLQAAIHVAATRHAIRSYAMLDPSPGRVLTLANEVLVKGDPGESGLATAFFAVFDPAKETVTYASAGHPAPMICASEKRIEELDEAGGMMLGILSGYNYPEATRVLSLEDTVVMFTDGISEARRDSATLFDTKGIIDYLSRHCGDAPEEVVAGLLKAAIDHAGGGLQDDAAIVLLRRIGDNSG